MLPAFIASPLFATRINDMWYALPIITAVSLVYSATRHEAPLPIIWGALQWAAWISGFMLLVFILLFALSSML